MSALACLALHMGMETSILEAQPEHCHALSMPTSPSKNTYALHLDTGELVAAADVTQENKQGPWKCSSSACELRLTHVRGAYPSSATGVPTERAPHFKRKVPKTLHSEQCDVRANDAEAMAKYASRKGKPRRDETVLIQFGLRPAPPVHVAGPASPQNQGSGPGYVGKPGSMQALLSLIESSGGEDQMHKHWYTHHGTSYRWRDIAYKAEQSEFIRLHDEVSGIFNFDKYRPWVIRGTIRESAAESKSGDNTKFIVIGATESSPVPKVRAFAPSNLGFENLWKEAIPGRQVAFLLSKVRTTDLAHGVYGYLTSPTDLVFLS